MTKFQLFLKRNLINCQPKPNVLNISPTIFPLVIYQFAGFVCAFEKHMNEQICKIFVQFKNGNRMVFDKYQILVKNKTPEILVVKSKLIARNKSGDSINKFYCLGHNEILKLYMFNSNI